MKNLSLKLDNDVYEETERLLKEIRSSRNRYINDALRYYNALQQDRLLARQLKVESALVAEESLRYASELNALEDLDEEAI
jgi:metal-responsive CopG/Arc/MetJ family transcriptional regulator